MIKKELRKIYRQKRYELTHRQREKFSDLILINFQQIELPFLRCIHSYVAAETHAEPDSAAIIRYLEFKNPGLKIAVPKIEDAILQHIELTNETELVLNSFGIAEPLSGNKIEASEIDLVLVPLLAFNDKGFRVGYGKGHYDKFLAQCRNDVITVGLSFFDAVDTIDDTDQFDISLKYCVTPHRVYEFD
jgi:5-formyltetrahydrofolate cyclo-ligase